MVPTKGPMRYNSRDPGCEHLHVCITAKSMTAIHGKCEVFSVIATLDLSLFSLQVTPCMLCCLLSGDTSISKTVPLNSQAVFSMMLELENAP